jgi:hypothetical protein
MLNAKPWRAYRRRDCHMVPLQESREINAHPARESARNCPDKTQHSLLVVECKQQAAYFTSRSEVWNVTDDYKRLPQIYSGTCILAFGRTRHFTRDVASHSSREFKNPTDFWRQRNGPYRYSASAVTSNFRTDHICASRYLSVRRHSPRLWVRRVEGDHTLRQKVPSLVDLMTECRRSTQCMAGPLVPGTQMSQ